MKLVHFGREDETAQKFVAALVPRCANGFGNCRSSGVIDAGGKLVCGWIWHDWDPHAGVMEFSGAAIDSRWMTRTILHELFAYAFEGCECQMIVTRNSAENTRLHRQLKAFGFDRFDIPRLFGRDEDGVVWSLTDEQWKEGRFYVKTVSAHSP